METRRRNITSSVHALEVLLKLTGFLPLDTINAETEQTTAKMGVVRRFFRAKCVHCIFVQIAILISFSKVVLCHDAEFPQASVTIKIMTTINFVVLGTSTFITLFLSSFIYQNSFYSVLFSLTKVDEKLLKHKNRTYESTQNYIKIYLGFTFVFMLLFSIYHITINLTKIYNGSYRFLVLILFFFISNTSFDEYFVFIALIFQRYRILNNQLIRVFGNRSEKDLDAEVFGWDTEMPNDEDFTKVFRRSNIPKIVWNSRLNKDVSRRVHSLRKLHDELYQTVQLFNDTFGLRLLVKLTETFVNITTYVYFLLLTVTSHEYEPSRGVLEDVLSCLTWLLAHVFALLCTAWCCHLAAAEANRAAVLVQKLLLLGRASASDAASANDQLAAFSQQLLHSRVGFSAAGFFAVDYSLVYEVAGAVTTYIVILMQFHK